MGILFGQKTEGGSTIYRRRVPRAQLSKRSVRASVEKLGGMSRRIKRYIRREVIMPHRKGGITQEEVHDEIQEAVDERDITLKRARTISRKLGLRRSQRHFVRHHERESASQQDASGEKVEKENEETKREESVRFRVAAAQEKEQQEEDDDRNKKTTIKKTVWDAIDERQPERFH